jgi:hypothetical protein
MRMRIRHSIGIRVHSDVQLYSLYAVQLYGYAFGRDAPATHTSITASHQQQALSKRGIRSTAWCKHHPGHSSESDIAAREIVIMPEHSSPPDSASCTTQRMRPWLPPHTNSTPMVAGTRPREHPCCSPCRRLPAVPTCGARPVGAYLRCLPEVPALSPPTCGARHVPARPVRAALSTAR